VNLIAEREVVPEFIQDNFTAANVVLHLRRLMHNEEDRRRMREDLRQVSALLQASNLADHDENRRGAIERVAEITMHLISPHASPQTSSALLTKAQ
jgi:lipid-A-disaccharide synthase